MGAHQPLRLTRRDFLAALGAAAGAGAVASCRRAGEMLGVLDPEIPGELLGPSRAAGHLLRGGGLPVPDRVEKVPVVVVGGGIAGLSAGWKLLRSGFSDFVILDLEERAGGNAAWGENAVSAYPWGAHYLPVPGPEARAVRELLGEFGVIVGEEGGRPVYDERFLCHAPEERLFIHGRWQEGLFPRLGASREDLRQREAFDAEMSAFRKRRGRDGRRAFVIPVDESSRDPELLALDELSMARWLDARGYDSPRLRWFVEYACRDDFGASLSETSAWAAVHYFAARGVGRDDRLLVWPQGNGWLAERLASSLGPRLRPGRLVYDISQGSDGVSVDWLDVRSRAAGRFLARQAIVATPRFAARRIVAPLREDRRPCGFRYAPWLTANLTLEVPAEERGAALAWDNVIYDSPGLGYVDASHQSLSLDRREAVWTYYRALVGDPSARRAEAEAKTWSDWKELCLADLERAHPGLRRRVRRLDAWVWGHGMIRPGPGFVWGAERREASRAIGDIHFAHSDLSGLSIFEEAQYHGVAAAQAVLSHLGRPFRRSV